ncbi:hypothetical protein ACIBCN_20050 [Nocardia sp. NPDC051052]|uniref:hypothetical protein n=1 Tax=Nocardia sp. NPDC051052 TaxID=3364322 RepID=UPI0037939B97
MPAATVYTCRVTNWGMLWLNIFVLFSCTLGFVIGTDPWRFLTLAAVIVALVKVIAQASLRVSAGPGGLTVNFAVFGFPRVAIGRADIARAEIIDLPVKFWSRWGVFHQRKRGWFLTPTLGPALRLTLTSGRTVTVSMPEPRAALWAMGIAP